MTLDEKLNHIRDAILKYVPAKYIYLFGSYAYGEPTEESDIDIYAVVPDGIEKWTLLNMYGDIQGELCDVYDMYGVDLKLHYESTFEKYKKLSRFEGTIYEKGRLLYAVT